MLKAIENDVLQKEIQSDAFAKWVISWRRTHVRKQITGTLAVCNSRWILRQTLIERQQHAETCHLKDQMEKLRRAEDESWNEHEWLKD